HLRAFCHGLSVLIWILFLVYVAKPPIAIDDMGEGRTFGVVQRAAKGLSDWRARGRNNYGLGHAVLQFAGHAAFAAHPRARQCRSARQLWNRRLDEGAEASYGFADDQRVHFARSFIRIDSFGVGNEATDMVLEQDAVAAEHFARIADSLSAFDR